MRNIKDLKPNECIKISTKKEARKIFELLGRNPTYNLKLYVGFYVFFSEPYPEMIFSENYLSKGMVSVNASEFLPKKHSRKKQLYNSIAENTHDIQALQSAFKILADKVDSLPSVNWSDNGIVKVNIPGLKLEDSVTISPEALLFEPASKPESLTELPEKWYISVNDGNRGMIEKWRSGLESLRNKTLSYGLYVNESGRGFSGIPESTEISTEDFKRLVLKENVLEVGNWYKDKSRVDTSVPYRFIFIKNINEGSIETCGFDGFGNWFTESYYNLDEAVLATQQEVQSSLINEAEKRYKFEQEINAIDDTENGSPVRKQPLIGSDYQFKDGRLFSLGFGKWCVFKNGIWAEIVKPVKEEIDWSKPGQLFEAVSDGCIILNSGESNERQMQGIIVYSTTNAYPLGCFKCGWLKSDLKLYTGEPITLSN